MTNTNGLLLRCLDRCVQTLDYVLGALAAGCLIVMFLLMICEVLMRGILGYSLGFTWEVNGYLMGGIIFLGLSNALRHNSHIRIRILLNLLPEKLSRWLDVFATLVAITISVYLLRAMSLLTWTSYIRNSVSSTPEQIPLAWPQAALCFGLLVFVLQLFVILIRLLSSPQSPAAPSTSH